MSCRLEKHGYSFAPRLDHAVVFIYISVLHFPRVFYTINVCLSILYAMKFLIEHVILHYSDRVTDSGVRCLMVLPFDSS